MLPRVCLLAVALECLSPGAALAQDRERKRAAATRVPDGSIRMDGRLDEPVWREAMPLAGFTQKEPVEGNPATDDLDVRFVYDAGALYVGARMTSSAPIQAPLGRRDEVEQAEHLLVSLDTYLDRRTASTFGVTANGVRLDYYYASDNDFDDDDTFNPVWEARTSMDERGWIAELRIPFSQLRFNPRSPQVWGLNVRRWIPSLNEEVFWSPIRRTDERWASLFGDLHGLDVQPRQRVELLPYVTGNSQFIGNRDAADPFNEGANPGGGAGVDVKLGIGSNLTLEGTVNPDFGQVEADPAEVNLSAFETFFDERRPFFVEGANLLSGNVEDYFYSRRIGAPPQGRAPGDLRGLSADHHHSRRCQAHRPAGFRNIAGDADRRDRRRGRSHLQQQRVRRGARGAAHLLQRRAHRAAVRAAVIQRGAHDHGRSPPVRRRRSAGVAARAKCLHAQRRFHPAFRRPGGAEFSRGHVCGRRARCTPASPTIERALLPTPGCHLRAARPVAPAAVGRQRRHLHRAAERAPLAVGGRRLLHDTGVRDQRHRPAGQGRWRAAVQRAGVSGDDAGTLVATVRDQRRAATGVELRRRRPDVGHRDPSST